MPLLRVTQSNLFYVKPRVAVVKGEPWGVLGFRIFPGYFVRLPPRPIHLAAGKFRMGFAAVKFGRGSHNLHLRFCDVTGCEV